MKSKIKVRLTEFACRNLEDIKLHDPDSYEKLLVRIEELGLDPLPSNEECESKTIHTLRQYGIRRLKCVDVLAYRVFYRYTGREVIVYCVIKRSEDTYKEDSPCYMRIKLEQRYLRQRLRSEPR